MKALSQGPVERADAARVMQRDSASVRRLIDDLIGEGLCRDDGGVLGLPD